MADALKQNIEWLDSHQSHKTKFQWGTDYGKDLLVDLNQLAHAYGTGALHRDALQRAFVEITRLRKQLADRHLT